MSDVGHGNVPPAVRHRTMSSPVATEVSAAPESTVGATSVQNTSMAVNMSTVSDTTSVASATNRRPFGGNTPNHSRNTSRRMTNLDASMSGGTPRPGTSGQASPVPDDAASIEVVFDGRSRVGAPSSTGTVPPSVAAPMRRTTLNAGDAAEEQQELVGTSEDMPQSSGAKTDPSTAPADLQPVRSIGHRRQSSLDFHGQRQRQLRAEAVAARGEDTQWTMLTDTMCTAWLAAFLVYVLGDLGMGVAAWRAVESIPSDAAALRAASSGSNVTSAPRSGQATSHAPCGTPVERSLIAIALFMVLAALLVLGWVIFFGLGVLPKLRQHRPGVGHVPFTFWSVFTPFVAYSALTGLVVIATTGVCLFSLSITRIDDEYVEDICGTPFVTLRIVAIVFLTITFSMLAVYGVHAHVLARTARDKNRLQEASQYSTRNIVEY